MMKLHPFVCPASPETFLTGGKGASAHRKVVKALAEHLCNDMIRAVLERWGCESVKQIVALKNN